MAGESATTGKTTAAEVAAAVDARIRHDWLDALKGIGIILVVAGHIWTRGVFRDAIYAFHMPLFFMATGAVTRATPWRITLPRMARGLILPFISFGLLLLGLDFLIEGYRGVRPIFPDLETGIWQIVFETDRLRGPFGIFWFVPCLFIARFLWNALLLHAGDANSRLTLSAVAAAALITVVIGLWGPWPPGSSPLGLLPMPAALILLWAGYLWRDWRPAPATAWTLTLFGLMSLPLFLPLNMRAGDFGPPLLGLAAAFALTDRLAWLTRRMPLSLMHHLARVGRNSLVLMFAHLAFVHYLWAYLPKLALFLAAVAGPLLFGWLVRQNRLTRLYILGER